MTNQKLARKLQIATIGAASALLLAPLASAQSEESDQAQVTVESSEPKVSVQQAEPEVQVQDSADPNVNVTDDKENAEVVVEQPEPKVTVNMPEPEVEVVQADSAEGGEASQAADAQAEQQQQPEAQVEQEQPEVTANQEPAQPAPPEPTPLEQLRVADLEGQTVYNTGGEELGSIESVVMANGGNEAGVVISMGGLLGFFEDQVLVPFSEMQLDGDQLVWETNMTTEEMENTEYEEQNYTEVSPQDYELVGDLTGSQ